MFIMEIVFRLYWQSSLYMFVVLPTPDLDQGMREEILAILTLQP